MSSAMAGRFCWLVRLICLFLCATLECRREQRATIKACASWGFDVRRTLNSVCAVWGDHTLSVTQVRHWWKVYKQDPERNTADCKRPGRPRSRRNPEGVARLQNAVDSDRRKTIRQLAQETEMSTTTVHKMLHKELTMRKIAPAFVPHRLTQRQRNQRLQIARQHLQAINSDPELLHKLVATDETWVYMYDPRSKKCEVLCWGRATCKLGCLD